LLELEKHIEKTKYKEIDIIEEKKMIEEASKYYRYFLDGKTIDEMTMANRFAKND